MEADFLAIYGIRDWDEEIDAPTFFILAQRVFAYEGVMRGRLLAEQAKEQDKDSETPLPLTKSDPVFAELVDWG